MTFEYTRENNIIIFSERFVKMNTYEILFNKNLTTEESNFLIEQINNTFLSIEELTYEVETQKFRFQSSIENYDIDAIENFISAAYNTSVLSKKGEIFYIGAERNNTGTDFFLVSSLILIPQYAYSQIEIVGKTENKSNIFYLSVFDKLTNTYISQNLEIQSSENKFSCIEQISSLSIKKYEMEIHVKTESSVDIDTIRFY